MLRKYSNDYIAIYMSPIIIGIFYSVVYISSIKYSNMKIVAGYLSLIGEVGLDCLALSIAIYLFFSHKSEYKNKIIFLLLAGSFAAAILSDSAYNILLNLFHIKNLNTNIILLFDFPFSIFLLLQMAIWGAVLFLNRDRAINMTISAYMPYFLISSLLFSMFMFGVLWEIDYFSLLGFFQIIDTVLEVIGFGLATICLARAKTKIILFMASGYLLIVASDFIIRYHVVTGFVPDLNPFEGTWIFGLLLMCLGLYSVRSVENKNYFELSSINSIQSKIAVWMLLLWLISAILFYSLFATDLTRNFNQLNRNFLSILIPFCVLAVISSNYISTKISRPLCNLEEIIKNLMNQEELNLPNSNFTKRNTKSTILEFITLEIFFYNAFSIYKKKFDAEVQFSKIAKQVAHDIRSPLAALDILTNHLPELQESKRILLREATRHIRDIVNNLENTSFLNKRENQSITQLAYLLDYVVSERRIAFSNQFIEINYHFNDKYYDLFIDVVPSEFKRVLTNIINNACEAILPGNGRVEVNIAKEEKYIVISIVDDGEGIPKKMIPSLFTRGVTTKSMGSGLGLYHARESLGKWGGNVELTSNIMRGCTAVIKLPMQMTPIWFASNLSFSTNATIVCVDDSISVWHIWQEKFSAISDKIKMHYCNTKEDLLKEIERQDVKSHVYLVDYEFSSKSYTGVDLINIILASGISSERIYLVTSHSSETEIQHFCILNKIRIIPKNFALAVPVQI